ncbi:PAS domain-containing protein [Gloeocapsa sp. PCC 7428]|uniref:PAS domain-containing protein n=1 Tax=Gloeocapsa sp. PCC 7428 TaxID=1173026 RepID=UPI00031DDC5B|nr:PAS domain-containing protein [Gloeocapsa sp. PCC 7428]
MLTCGAIALKTILESTYSQSLQTYFPLIIFGCISVAVITLGKAIVWLLNRWQFDKRFFLASGTLVKSFAGMHDMKMAMLPMLVGSVTFCISTFWLKLHFAKKTAFWWQVGVAIAILAVSAGIHYAYPTAQLAIEVADLTTIVVLLLVVQQALSSRRLYTEVALAESQRRLATLIDSLPGIAFACSNDPNWSMTYVSEGCLELTGYCSEELIGITGLYNAITHPKDLPRVLQSITKAVEAQQPYVIEYRINTKSGEQKWLWEKGSGVFDSHGQVLGLEGFITDISELKRSEAALKESEQRYRELFESHPCPMWVYDIETLAFLAVNNAAIAHYGYERDEFLSMTIKDIRPSEDVASLLQQLKHLKSELSPHGIWRHRKKDGTIIKVEVSCHSLTFLGKRAAVVSAHDVTKRIQTEEALRQAEAKYRSIFENASEGIFQTTPTGQYLSANPALARIYGYDSPEELVATVTNIEKQLYVDPHRRAECIRLMQQHNCVSGFESQVYRKDGSTIWISENARIVRNIHGDIVCYEGTVEDITTRKQTEAAQARFTAILEATTDFVGIADSQGKPLYLNQAGYKILGLDPQQDISRLNIFDCHPDWANQIFLDTVVPTLLSRGVWNGEMALLNRQKEEIPVSQVIVAKSSAAGELDFVATIARDISERKRLEAQLSYLANHDSLTGLFNRRYFQAQLEHYLELALERDRESGALVLIDIDDFKDINDTLGHKAGDDLLKNLATLLQEQIEEKDILARLGGDEFAILVPQISLHDVDLIKQKIVGALKNHVVIANGQPVRITASIGATVFPDHGIVADELFAHADLAMYKSKKLGSNCFSLYTPDPHWQVQIQSRNFWKNQIREALEQNLFVLYCQPILDLQQNTFSCYEILIRMLGKDKEIISPNTFLPIAEECGLISHIDRWVVCQAIHLIANQAKVGNNLRLEVNISGKSLSDSELLPMIQQELATTGINPASLVLEITETAAIADFSQARKFINTLKQIGCQFAIDDFGMGYSSFAQLKHLPVDYLKIDGSFIKNLAKDVLDRHLVKAIVEVARGLSIATIAEFVALPETLQLLHELGVNYAQGYYIGEPMPVAELSNQWGSIANDEARRSHWHLSTQIVKQAYTLTSS